MPAPRPPAASPPRLSPHLLVLLTLPPLVWAGNAVVGRAVTEQVPPVLLNTLRWTLALALLLPFTQGLWQRRTEWVPSWRWWLMTGILGMASYNALLYQALHTVSPVNVTLIAASLPVAMLLVGAMFFQRPATPHQVVGAALCAAGVLMVVSQGQWQRLLALQVSAGDLLMLLATLAWAGYSWLLTRPPPGLGADWPWTNTLALQMMMGLAVGAPLSGLEQSWTHVPLRWDLGMGAALLFIALGPSLLAYRCWGLGVAQGGPALASVFANLTPVFTALLAALLLAEPPQAHHGWAFLLIAAGISVSARSVGAAKP
ncbi:MAG: DMT family transporter [Inhella sp.]|jgi:drug/metabolite transporter (DMT)-like permease|uniref:DMT family transporter n=1 Tax=Inhella sp. TaxID=1921806 RepID=UPI0022BC035A|nr:DMT family transporter [Inhella sp.]MCZ8236709.1 DMT family transporter [Inhella sp.]